MVYFFFFGFCFSSGTSTCCHRFICITRSDYAYANRFRKAFRRVGVIDVFIAEWIEERSFRPGGMKEADEGREWCTRPPERDEKELPPLVKRSSELGERLQTLKCHFLHSASADEGLGLMKNGSHYERDLWPPLPLNPALRRCNFLTLHAVTKNNNNNNAQASLSWDHQTNGQ